MRDASGTSLLNQPRERSLDERFRTLYDTHRCRVRGLIRKRFSDDAVVDDLVQEVFARAYTALPSLDPETPPWPWLATVARNLCADEFRRRSRESFTALPATESTDGPETRALAGVGRSEVVEALTAIHPRQAELLVRRHVDGLGYRELATLDGSSVTVVKSVLGRARRRFREHYREIIERTGLPVAAAFTALRDWLELQTRRATTATTIPEMSAAAHSLPGTVSAAATTVVVGVTALLGPQLAPPPPSNTPSPPPAAAWFTTPPSLGEAADPEGTQGPPADPATTSAPPTASSEVVDDAASIDVEVPPLPAAPVIAPPAAPISDAQVPPPLGVDEVVGTDTPAPPA